MRTVRLKMDAFTYARLVEMRSFVGSFSKILVRAIDVTDISNLTYHINAKKYIQVSIKQDTEDKLINIASAVKLSVSNTASVILAKYLWSLKEGLEKRERMIPSGGVGVTFTADQYLEVDAFLTSQDRTFGYVVKKAIRESDKPIVVEWANRSKRSLERGNKLYARLNSDDAAGLTKLVDGKAITSSEAVKEVVLRYIRNQ